MLYWLKEQLHINGLPNLAFRAVLLALGAYLVIGYFFGSETHPAPSTSSPPVQVNPLEANRIEKPPTVINLTQDDLQKKMTSKQSAEYWHNFQKVMTYSKPAQWYGFNSTGMQLAYLTGDKFTTQKGHTCRPYAELLIIGERTNQRQAISCQKAPGNWCHVSETGRLHCRTEEPGGLEGLQLETGIELRNFNNSVSRTMDRLPF